MNDQTKPLTGLSSGQKRELLLKLIQEQGVAQPKVRPASFGQERLWFLAQLEPDSIAYNMHLAFRIGGALNVEALQLSLNRIVERHEVLRTTFRLIEGQLVQVIAPLLTIELPVIDIQKLPSSEREAATLRMVRQEAQKPFDLQRGPLLRAVLSRLSADDHVLLITTHHSVFDGWSTNIFLRELGSFYAYNCQSEHESAINADTGSSKLCLPGELPIQYADFAQWQRDWLRGETLEKDLAYWMAQLGDESSLLELPLDRPRPPIQTYNGAMHQFELPEELLDRLRRLCRDENVTLFMTLLAAFKTLLYRYSGQQDIVVGSSVAGRTRLELEELIGFFVNTLVLRTDISGNPTFRELLRRVRTAAVEAYAHQELPFERLVEELHPERDPSRTPLFQVMFSFNNTPGATLELENLDVSRIVTNAGAAKFDLDLSMEETERSLRGYLVYNSDLFNSETIERMVAHLQVLLAGVAASPDAKLMELCMLTESERCQLLIAWNETKIDYPTDKCIHQLFEAQVQRTPHAIAVKVQQQELTYAELDERANRLACYLRMKGVKPEQRVAVCVDRSLDMLVALLGVLKAGGAYVPLDPSYPDERLILMLGDGGASLLVTKQPFAQRFSRYLSEEHVVCLDSDSAQIPRSREWHDDVGVVPSNLAYVIYTSGSTGRPKGVMVQHSSVVNFFYAMRDTLGIDAGRVWLAITSMSFDISVLEMLWTLTEGNQVVVYPDQLHLGGTLSGETSPGSDTQPGVQESGYQEARVQQRHTRGGTMQSAGRDLAFSLFYFADDSEAGQDGRYNLLMEGAKFADKHGFLAVWTPERHFHPFGGLYPNPSVISAALAMVTEQVQIRAGSVVLPLHDPIRVAEEWSVVDNLSRGRVGISFASGWHPNDFVLAPANYPTRKEGMLLEIETVRQLWSGGSILREGPNGNNVEVHIHPRPVQAELPIWITAAANPETFRLAGQLGFGVLTHLLGQSLEELEEKVAIYRKAWRLAGHGPGPGAVTVMLHTFVGEDLDAVRTKVQKPFSAYLLSSFDLVAKQSRVSGWSSGNLDPQTMNPDDLEALIARAFDHYFETSGLFGTPETCLATIRRLTRIGVDEVACLIDFGVDTASALEGLRYLDELKELSKARVSAQGPLDGATAEGEHSRLAHGISLKAPAISHLQCTPSTAQMLLLDPAVNPIWGSLKQLLLGGERLPSHLVTQLRERTAAQVFNMYGPTETTIWSTTYQVDGKEAKVPIGRPVGNTQVYVLDQYLQLTPIGVPGRLFIGGTGVVRGYLNRPDLTAERFIPDPFAGYPGARMYDTGDLARYSVDGNLEFLGRVDNQVKLRGHRIELGEIEYVLRQYEGVHEVVVVYKEVAPDDQRLVAYIVPQGAEDRDPNGKSKSHVLSTVELSNFVRTRLPSYMVPNTFFLMNSLPRTPSGKIDLRALPNPEQVGSEPPAMYVAPSTAVEQVLVMIWADMLGIERVGINDDFFALGGHSLLATQVISLIREALGVELPLRMLFEAPTVARLARSLAGHVRDAGQLDSNAELWLQVSQLSEDDAEEALRRRTTTPGEHQ